MNTTAAVCLVLLGAFALAAMLQRRNAKRSEPDARLRLRRTDSLALTAQHTLHVVEWGGQRWLVGCHAGGTTRLARLERSLECTTETGQR